MLEKRKKYYLGLFILLIVTTLSSCSKFERLVKSNDFGLKYQKALEMYDKKEWYKAGVLFDNISPFYRATTKIDTISFYNAMCKYNQKDYLFAAYSLKEHYEMYPKSPFIEETYYMYAYALYLMSPRPSLDQESTLKAIEGFREFMRRFPESDKAQKSYSYIKIMMDKLIEKSFMNARLYYDLEEYKASIIALNNSLDEFPETKHREMVLFLILKSNFLLAENSIASKKQERYQNTLDAYYSFIEEFPTSSYINEAKKIYATTDKALNLNKQ